VDLRGDCANCFGLCCVALPFTASSGAAGFALSKPAGTPCPHLDGAFTCGIHASLRTEGFAGCTVYDCFGAGQQVSRHTFGGRDWRADPAGARQMFAVFPVMRDLHELLWYVAEALTLPAAGALVPELRRVRADLRELTGADPGVLDKLDVTPLRQRVGALLERAGQLARAGLPGAYHRGADLAGARLAGADLRGADLRGALLIAADLRSADLRSAQLLGADLRDTDLRGANLTGALFLTRLQVAAARGDAATRLPGHLDRPAHWAA
jgi:uncharacterized protein YjbI with pentapeptide repeats